MSSDTVPQILLILLFVFLSGFFSLLKSSYENMNLFKLEKMIEAEEIDEKDSLLMKRIIQNPQKVQNSLMIADYLSNALVATLSARIGYRIYGEIGMLIALLIAVILILVIGENTPYSISLIKGDKAAIKFVGLTKTITRVLFPIQTLVKFFSSALATLFGATKDYREPKITEDELITAVNLGAEEGLLDKDEYGLIEKIFQFSDSYAKDVMTPRTDVMALDIEKPLDEMIEIFLEEGYSRMPVYEEDIDNILGVLHVKDILPYVVNNEKIDIRKTLRKPLYTFEYQKTSDLFRQMRMKRSTFAIVLDEYGGTDGIVTLEDLVEEIVGELEDEYDDTYDKDIIRIREGEYILDGMAKIEDINEELDLSLESEEVETIGGFVLEKIDKIPKVNDKLQFENLIFTILEMDKNRIEKMKLNINTIIDDQN